jgi:hypothetical protein
LALYVNERRRELEIPPWNPAQEVCERVLVHGVAVLEWAAMYDLELARPDPFLRLLCQSHLRDNPRIGAFVIYNVLEHFALNNPCIVANLPPCRREPIKFRRWLLELMGKLGGIAGDEATTLESVVARYSETLGGDQSPILLWPMHEVTAELLVRGAWPSDIVGLWRGDRSQRRVRSHRSCVLLHKAFNQCYRPTTTELEQLQACIRGPLAFSDLPAPVDPAEPLLSVSVPVVKRHIVAARRGEVAHEFNVDFMIDCTLASFYLRDMGTIGKTAAVMHNAEFGHAAAERVREAQQQNGFMWPGRHVLRFSRIRLDLTVSLYRRVHCSSRLEPFISRELMIDASPLLGRELLMIKEFIVTFSQPGSAPSVEERMFHPQTLAYRHQATADKAMTTLHAVWSEYGFSFESMHQWARSVRCVPTDFGVESSICNVGNLLPRFYGMPADASSELFLLPLALRIPGWMHLCDNLVKYAIEKCLEWFNEWHLMAQKLCDFLSTATYTDVLSINLCSLQLYGLSKQLQTSTENMLKLRWGSIVRTARDLSDRRHAFTIAVGEGGFDESGDYIREAVSLGDDTAIARLFWARTRFIALIFGIVEDLRTWGAGCDCHEDDRINGRRVLCSLTGRRLLLIVFRCFLTPVSFKFVNWFCVNCVSVFVLGF